MKKSKTDLSNVIELFKTEEVILKPEELAKQMNVKESYLIFICKKLKKEDKIKDYSYSAANKTLTITVYIKTQQETEHIIQKEQLFEKERESIIASIFGG